MIKIKCAICGKEIINPKINQIMCGSEECQKAYHKAYQKAYRKTDKYKAYHKAYRKTDKYKAYQKAYRKTDRKALHLLINNHKKEFEELKKQIEEKKDE